MKLMRAGESDCSSLLLLFGISRVSNGQDKAVPKPKKESTVKENRTCLYVLRGDSE